MIATLFLREAGVFMLPTSCRNAIELRQQGVSGVAAAEHGVERAVHDPGVLAGDAQDVVSHEGRYLGRVRHEERVELVQFNRSGWREERGVPGRLLV